MESQSIKAGMLKGEVMSDKFKNALNEAEKKKKEKPKMLPKLHALDDRIEEFIQELEDKISAVKDNPIFVKKAFALLGDMSKEYSEFIAALRAIVNAVDRKGMSLPKEKPISRVRDINARHRDPEDEVAPPPENGAMPPEDGAMPPKGVKEALTFEHKKKITTNENIREALDKGKEFSLDFYECEHLEDADNYKNDIRKSGGLNIVAKLNYDAETCRIFFKVSNYNAFMKKFKKTDSYQFLN
jgi:hypothetical protein